MTTTIAPRICWVPESHSSLGERAVEFARRVGMRLDPEQELVLAGSLGVRENGRWQSAEVGLTAPRQNGKGEILIARELFGLYELGERFIVHSAHEFKTSERHFGRLEAVVRGCPELLARVKRADSGRVIGFRYSHGDEALELDDGSRIEFRTRTKSGMRGFDDVSLLVFDEAMIFAEAAQGAMMPTVRASKAPRGPQLWYAGSAVDQEIHEHGVVLARIRERGIAGDDDRMSYFEWSLPYERPEEVPDHVISDRDAWRSVNFAIDRGRVLLEQMELEFRSLSTRSFLTELLGVGDWPRTDGYEATPIPYPAWQLLEDPSSLLLDPVCLAFDVSPDRRSSIAAAGRRADGLLHVEILEHGPGTRWIPGKLADLVEHHDPIVVCCDGYGPAASVLAAVIEAGVNVETVSAAEHSQACGQMVDAVVEKQLRHLGSFELANAVRSAKTRPLGDAWAWSRKASTVDISPLVAATLALSKAAGLPDGLEDVSIY